MSRPLALHECPVDTTNIPQKPVMNHEQVKSKGRAQIKRKVLVDLDTSEEDSDQTVDTSSDQIVSAEPIDSTSMIIKEFGDDIMKGLMRNENENSGGLERHEVKGKHRKQMVQWMSEVLQVFKSPRETFFHSVMVMDRYFSEKRRIISLEELHEIGVASIFIASKYTELEPLTLELMHNKASHGKVTEKQIRLREIDILNTLKFKVSVPTLMDCTDNL